MSKKQLLFVGLVAFTLASCGSKKTGDVKTDVKDTSKTKQPADGNKSRGTIDPFKSFPLDPITGNKGDYVLSPSKNWQEDGTSGKENVTYIFYSQTLSETGPQFSNVDFMGEPAVSIPNYMIIPIKSGQTAKKGDIVLTWWQGGSGMMRAIVTDDKNPSQPTVCYLDLDWGSEKYPGFARKEETLKPNSFHVMTDVWEAGATVAAKDGDKYYNVTIVKVSGDNVLTIGFAGKMVVYPKSDCTPIALNPNVKKGDAVQAPWSSGSFVNTTVEKVDAKTGRVFCTDPYGGDPMVVPFGDVTSGLAIK